MMSAAADSRSLHRLARLYGVQTSYYDVLGQRQQASIEGLLAVLWALGAPVEGLEDVPDALRDRHQALWQRMLRPAVVAWDGRLPTINLRLPSNLADARVTCHIRLETGETQSWVADLQSPHSHVVDVEGVRYVVKQLSLPATSTLPWGYHHLMLSMQGKEFETMIIAAPLKAYAGGVRERAWGIFLPLYALHSQSSWGTGDLGDLKALIGWVASLGGSVMSTLPLLAAFLDEHPFEPSPYAPASRLFWNEFYLDVTRVPEFKHCPAAQAIVESTAFRDELAAIRSGSTVDYRRQMALKRRVLEELARYFFAQSSERQTELARFVEAHPETEDYARFRATGERQQTPWPAWPQTQRDGHLNDGDYDEEAKRYHLYVQWLAHTQFEAIAEQARAAGISLYLDMPLGVHSDSYDVWRMRSAFALGISGGAPPDAFFTKGQTWGFPPLHPERIRQAGYDIVIASLRHLLSHAGIIRIDHVMGLHRLFWVPNGMEAREGVYVRYPAEELYAILILESHRNQSLIVGEDLGTVPDYVRSAMSRHDIYRMHVGQFEIAPDPDRALPLFTANSVLSLNTHDIPTFTAFWRGLDIQDRIEMGLLDDDSARPEWEYREAQKQALVSYLQREGWLPEFTLQEADVVKAVLAFLSASPARIVLVNLEDLWLETQPQNVPGTWRERPNWQRKTRYSFETFRQMPEVLGPLQEVDRRRRREGGSQ